MPWKACEPMDERLKFVARLLDREKMAGLYREFGISRKTGYKIIARYNNCGLQGLSDRSSMRCPAELYASSTRPYRGVPDLHYPLHDKTVTGTTCGRICFHRHKINLSQVFAGQNVGIKQVTDPDLARHLHRL